MDGNGLRGGLQRSEQFRSARPERGAHNDGGDRPASGWNVGLIYCVAFPSLRIKTWGTHELWLVCIMEICANRGHPPSLGKTANQVICDLQTSAVTGTEKEHKKEAPRVI